MRQQDSPDSPQEMSAEVTRKAHAASIQNLRGTADSDHPRPRRSQAVSHAHRSGIPPAIGILVAITVLLVSAGTTFFLLTRPGQEDKLYRQGLAELDKGQYAFAVGTLKKAATLAPQDAKICLALARAHVGIDQVDRAWEYISQAQQLGAGIIADPRLASDLANYYRSRGSYEKAVRLMRPLAQAGTPGKREELSDLDAAWGDQQLKEGNLDLALKCWEEVKDLRAGSRFRESDARLSTIYRKMADELIATKDDTKALSYITKLNAIAPNPRNYKLAAEIYERQGQLELAIDQLTKATDMGLKDPASQKQLASYMARLGRELMDKGDTEAGYGYLQKARALDPLQSVTSVTLKNVDLDVSPASGEAHLTGQVWNPGPDTVDYLTMRFELKRTGSTRPLWTQEKQIIDEFEPPLPPHQSRSFAVHPAVPVGNRAGIEMSVYIDGTLYKSYSPGLRSADQNTRQEDGDEDGFSTTRVAPPAPAPARSPTTESTRDSAATRSQSDDLAPYDKGRPDRKKDPGEETLNDLDLF